ncbi:unnamed protein product [Adineta steineri]|uniref:Uncharacterized protein n=1 Tax=Adineta steineri TaxID=433720 RepID=A0A813M2S1_9BILA|nr:unnamed protein product [Adineta steineri]CAF4020332.1 unnamed protein product [Adineta steineri]
MYDSFYFIVVFGNSLKSNNNKRLEQTEIVIDEENSVDNIVKLRVIEGDNDDFQLPKVDDAGVYAERVSYETYI